MATWALHRLLDGTMRLRLRHPPPPPPNGTVGCPSVTDIHPIAGSRRASPESSFDSCVSVVGGEQRYQRHLKHRGWQDSERRLRIWGPMGRSPSSPKAVAKNVSKLSLPSCAAGQRRQRIQEVRVAAVVN
ncbi:Os06g0631800 [Oryza sativa Japonica Group]|uniref:Os06g0631950 protein n=3 Tax=Oryza TaxID=4527 RepID=A0A0P0WZ49_ORYSJ|nr:unknown protein [Oryza sativa Japonica Group]BAH93646.1 Os06g0631950 [Oryza sativa Japonica Group]BAS98733.1 Os06g0631800 [Oryza sativa Japonica Group]|eukprot:NP_001174918.1 Os06g0631950 [Oryza sativa Japonica Group]